MIQINFSQEDIKVVQYERFPHTHPHVMRKMKGTSSHHYITGSGND